MTGGATVALAALSAATLLAAVALLSVAYAIGGADATEDNWVGLVVAILGFLGILGALVAFVMAIMARVESKRWAQLWLPLCLFPSVVLLLVLGEVFWWE